MRLAVLVVLFLAFTGYSISVAASDGPIGFLTLALREKWGMQVLLDLAIALTVAWTWLRVDAKQRGITAWPYQVGTVLLGSIGVLAYLIHREVAAKKLPVAVPAQA